jgi:hypothetical protein
MTEIRPHVAVYGVALPGGIRTRYVRICLGRYRAELLTILVSGTLRRNVLGAIALSKERLQLPVATTTETKAEE